MRFLIRRPSPSLVLQRCVDEQPETCRKLRCHAAYEYVQLAIAVEISGGEREAAFGKRDWWIKRAITAAEEHRNRLILQCRKIGKAIAVKVARERRAVQTALNS